MKLIGFGPFLGDFECEVVTFRPYIKWVSEVTDVINENLFLFTHENRSFMYDWIPEKNFLYVYKQLTRDELEQEKHRHNNVLQKDFNLLVKVFKESIVKNRGCSKKDIDIINLSYIKNLPIYPVHQKSFTKIQAPDINILEKYKNRVIFIPHKEKREGRAEELYRFLRAEYDALIIGDLKINLDWDNIILKYIDYFENGFKYILKILSEAKFVVCPAGFWTYLCNLQKVPVFSYGPAPGPYRHGGVYHFNNMSSMVISYDDDTHPKSLMKMIKYFEEKL